MSFLNIVTKINYVKFKNKIKLKKNQHGDT